MEDGILGSRHKSNREKEAVSFLLLNQDSCACVYFFGHFSKIVFKGSFCNLQKARRPLLCFLLFVSFHVTAKVNSDISRSDNIISTQCC